MKAITLTQPWASLVSIGAKHIETRSWQTSYRGTLAIHAAKTFGVWKLSGIRWMMTQFPSFKTSLDSAGLLIETLPMSCIVATCNLIDCIPTHVLTSGFGELLGESYKLDQKELDFGDYTPGRFAWLLTDVQPFQEPVPARGALGLWDWTR